MAKEHDVFEDAEHLNDEELDQQLDQNQDHDDHDDDDHDDDNHDDDARVKSGEDDEGEGEEGVDPEREAIRARRREERRAFWDGTAERMLVDHMRDAHDIDLHAEDRPEIPPRS